MSGLTFSFKPAVPRVSARCRLRTLVEVFVHTDRRQARLIFHVDSQSFRTYAYIPLTAAGKEAKPLWSVLHTAVHHVFPLATSRASSRLSRPTKERTSAPCGTGKTSRSKRGANKRPSSVRERGKRRCTRCSGRRYVRRLPCTFQLSVHYCCSFGLSPSPLCNFFLSYRYRCPLEEGTKAR